MSTRSKRSNKIKHHIKTFTYFIPAPPHRKNGYREKEFDKIMAGILQSGLELMEFKVQGVESGMFVIALLKAPNSRIAKLDEDLDIQDKFKLTDSHSSPDIILEEDEDAL
jgi:hypothetical protein